ncbi:hypothetical protein RRG08_024123 [Elysia crispata]|uniref:Uncharacterized protein n=1 Tax=Elysia crispata TaxID=231223 RepID=A0AAE0YQ82_9GAST|nr:hypothetical protein RRG08_024123 [Elysia crispata]
MQAVTPGNAHDWRAASDLAIELSPNYRNTNRAKPHHRSHLMIPVVFYKRLFQILKNNDFNGVIGQHHYWPTNLSNTARTFQWHTICWKVRLGGAAHYSNCCLL